MFGGMRWSTHCYGMGRCLQLNGTNLHTRSTSIRKRLVTANLTDSRC